jgi:hypothetical protein
MRQDFWKVMLGGEGGDDQKQAPAFDHDNGWGRGFHVFQTIDSQMAVRLSALRAGHP